MWETFNLGWIVDADEQLQMFLKNSHLRPI